MRVPQVNERVKESPAQALRAMFASIGSLLPSRHKSSEPAAEPEAAAPETAAPETAAPETAAPETAAPETAAPETAAPETAAPETAAPETAAPEDAAALPVPNYDNLSIASLRARLRNLTPDQLTQIIEYEKGHANRADVIGMFERRIAKLAAGA